MVTLSRVVMRDAGSQRLGARRSLAFGVKSTLLAASGILCLPAHAQVPGRETSVRSDEIVVTARKREEAAIRVPVVATVLSSDIIDRAAINDVSDIAAFAPALEVGEAVLSAGTQVAIRGIGTSAYDPGVDQTVSLNIDGLSLSQGLAFQSGTFDLAQVEVLKGPQSLFFGKSAPAGVIALRTADPGDALEIMARAGYEIDAEEYRGELIFSTPISETLGVRLAGMFYDRKGYFRNRATALQGTGARDPKSRIGGGDGFQVRGTIVFEPSQSFDARLKLNYVDSSEGYPGTVQLASCPEGINVSPENPLPPPIHPNEDCKLDRNIFVVDMDSAGFPFLPEGGRSVNEKELMYGTLEMNFRPADELTITSVTGYYDQDSFTVYNTFQTSYSGTALAHTSDYTREEFTQEVRLNSDLTGPLNFTAGGFYQDAKAVLDQPIYLNQAFAPLPIASANVSELDIRTWSLFGQLRYRPVETLELALGGRYTDEKRRNEVFNNLTNSPEVLGVPQIRSKTFSPEVTVTYTPTDDLTIFGSYKKGYKSGSFTLSQLPPGPLPDPSFGDEKIEGVEAGMKSRFANRQLVLNFAGYYYDISGLQVGASVRDDTAPGSLPVVRTVNAGSGRVYGGDLELSYRPIAIEGLGIHAAIAWTNTKFTELNNIPCAGGQTIAQGCDQQLDPSTGRFTAQDLSGTRFLRAPEWEANFGFNYELPLANQGTITISNDYQYTSSYRTAPTLRRDHIQNEFLKVHASLAFADRDRGWELALIGKNLTDKITTGNCYLLNNQTNFFTRNQITGGTESGADGADELGCVAERGRSLWMRATVRFGG